MEQAITRGNRRAGWSDAEANLLWETADEAQQQGLPLKAVFERIAESTGRRPNSIRNYYYAQARSKKGEEHIAARFVPFSDEEVEWLITQVLIGRANGSSVRACLQKLAGGDHSLTLRYQNKYRAVLKSRPEYVKQLVEKLNGDGVECSAPEVSRRRRPSADDACRSLSESAYKSGDNDIVRACETFVALIESARRDEKFQSPSLVNAIQIFLKPIKNFLCMPEDDRRRELSGFTSEVKSMLGELEAQLPAGIV